MKKNYIIIVLLFLSNLSFSQVVRCYSDEMEVERKNQFPQLESRAQFEEWINSEINAPNQNRIIGGVFQIPVVFQVIHNGEAVGSGSNLSYAAIQSQLDVLNEDFRKMLGTNGYNTNPVGADTEIEFCMAKRRPDGSAFPNGEDGVNRISRSTAGFSAPPFSTTYIDATIKPYTFNNGTATATRGWHPGKYMNIWLCDISGGILGYAQFPESPLGGMGCGATATATDGVVFLYNSIGKSAVTGFAGPYNEGRTATHEIGHWLGLRHIWGDGGCTVDDFCNDTPEAASANYGCPTGTNSCTSAPDAGVSLINSDACIPPNLNDVSVIDITNPKGDNCPGSMSPIVTIKNRGSNNLTSAVVNYKIDNGSVLSFTYSGNLTPSSTANVTLPASTTYLGTHRLTAYTTLPNGVTDPSPEVDTVEIDFVVSNGTSAPYTQNFESDVFPPDIKWVVENANADCYEWFCSR